MGVLTTSFGFSCYFIFALSFSARSKIICILGNTAFNSLLGGSEIIKFRGKLVRKDDQLYFLTIHPAATIYNQGLIEVLKSDIVKLFNLIITLIILCYHSLKLSITFTADTKELKITYPMQKNIKLMI